MQLKRRNLKHYPNLTDEFKYKSNISYNKYADIIALLLKESERFLTLNERYCQHFLAHLMTTSMLKV